MKKFVLYCSLCVLAISMHTHAALMEVTISGNVQANQTINNICRTQGFNVCHYFPLGDAISMSFVYDDQTPQAYVQNGTSAFYDNAIKSISFNSTHVAYSGSDSGSFGQFIVRNAIKDGLTFRLWEPTQNRFAYASANAMDLTTLQTEVAHATDDVYGDIEIDTILVNLTALSGTLFNSLAMTTSFNLSDFDDPVNTNWGFNVRSSSGFGGSVGVGISSVSVSVLGAKEGSPSTVPAPMTLVLMLSGLALLVRTTQRKT